MRTRIEVLEPSRYLTRLRGFLAACLCVLVVVGCGRSGPPLVPVEGTVVDKNGTPVYPGSIWLIPVQASESSEAPSEGSSSVLGEGGRFRIRTYPHGDGAPAGRYRVTLSLGPGASPDLARYSSPTKSPILVDIPPDGNPELSLQLEGSASGGSRAAGPPGARRRQ